MSRVALIMKRTGNARVVADALAPAGFESVAVAHVDELRVLLGGSPSFDLALLDVSGFGSSVWNICAELQAKQVPFIVLSAPGESVIGNRSLRYGALGLLHKPVARTVLLQLIRNLA